MEIITPGIPYMEDCPILTRIKSFIVTQGVICSLQHVFRNRQGVVVNLTTYIDAPSSDSDSESETTDGSVVLRIKEWIVGPGTAHAREFTLEADSPDPANGVVTADLTAAIVEYSGIYELSWGIKDADGNVVMVNDGIMSVERSLFAAASRTRRRALGPPTINEIRMWMMDSSPNENLLLDDVEFKDEQIILALTDPVRRWNEALPPIKTYNTRDFPFRGAWACGTLAALYRMAAAHYRRNRLGSAAGGITVDDKNKEREYLGESERLESQYMQWMQDKKVSMNMKLFSGQITSEYSNSGW